MTRDHEGTKRPKSCRGRLALLLGAALALAIPYAVVADDTVLFSTFVQPNVMLLLDSSGSMNHIVWHPDYDPAVASTCTAFSNSSDYFYNSNTSRTYCGNTRWIYVDPAIGGDSTRWSGHYLNWYFSNAADSAYTEIQQTNNGFPSACLGGASFAKYRRARITAAKQAIRDIVCEVNQLTSVKFGLARFRDPDYGDPNGGFVIEEIAEYDATHASNIDSALSSVTANSWTPLGESLFQVYTFFMSRTTADRPYGKNGTTRFPVYNYNTSTAGVGGEVAAVSSDIPVDPVEYACQKNFVIVLTDGEPTYDDFDANTPTSTAVGFGNVFKNELIGDYNVDGETEESRDLVCSYCWSGFYLDDIALFMRTNDFRLDFDGDQFIDTYTVGFTTGPLANALLQKTADVGNGIFFHANDADQLADAIVTAFGDILTKSQSFTAATVPATRTAAGESLFVSQFIPSNTLPYWQGNLKHYEITGAGEIRDSAGNCAVDDPNPGQCYQGPFLPSAVPFWDAAQEVPAPGARNLFTSKLNLLGVPGKTAFDNALTSLDLGVVFPPSLMPTGSTALGAEGLTDEIVQNVRGCEMGTGVLDGLLVGTPAACVERSSTFGDIFHSNPMIVGSPALFLGEQAYNNFANMYAQRDQIIYAGTNDGWLRAIHAGDWDTSLNPQRHNRGTGTEEFGFMPWFARQQIRHLPTDTNGRDYYFVDGSPQAADVWMYASASQSTKATDGSEWATILVTGMRQGGENWVGLDITNPASAGYPGYLWEFPRENDPASIRDLVGETWSDPIITKVRVKIGSDDNGGQGYERWVAVMGGGYDATSDPNNPTAYNATATKGRSILIVDVKTGRLLAKKSFNAAASPGDPEGEMAYAIPSTVGVYDLDFDGYADVLYVGDLGGNVWKWAIKEIGDDRVNDGSGSLTQPNWPFVKFFDAPEWQLTAGDPVHYKSFYFPPAATLRNGLLWLAFGSGERNNLRFEGEANEDGDNNRFYAMNDIDPYETNVPAQTLPITENELLDTSTDTSCADTSAYRGYYLIAADAEKFVTNVDIFIYYVFAASYIPSAPTDPCESGGESFLYVFRVYCGEGFFDDGAGGLDREISLGAGLPTDPKITVGTEGDSSHRVIINKQGGEIFSIEAPPGFQGTGMFYWRELFE